MVWHPSNLVGPVPHRPYGSYGARGGRGKGREGGYHPLGGKEKVVPFSSGVKLSTVTQFAGTAGNNIFKNKLFFTKKIKKITQNYYISFPPDRVTPSNFPCRISRYEI